MKIELSSPDITRNIAKQRLLNHADTSGPNHDGMDAVDLPSPNKAALTDGQLSQNKSIWSILIATYRSKML
jgi:hypothetical protein